MFNWQTWGAVIQVRRCNNDRYVQCDRLRRPRSSPSAIPEDTMDICTRDVRLIERKGVLKKNEPL
jgi:hypothetical protein